MVRRLRIETEALGSDPKKHMSASCVDASYKLFFILPSRGNKTFEYIPGPTTASKLNVLLSIYKGN